MDSVPRAASQIDGASSALVLRPQSAADADTAWKRSLVDDPDSAALVSLSVAAAVGMVRGVVRHPRISRDSA